MSRDVVSRLAEAIAALDNGRQRAFALAYLSDPQRNATRAYHAAGYRAKTDKSANAAASRLLADVKVAAVIAIADEHAAAKAAVTVERIEREFAAIAFADIRRAARFGPRGVELVESSTLDDETAAAISEVVAESRWEGGRREPDDEPVEVSKQRVKLHDKIAALRELAKRHGFYPPERTELTGADGAPLQTAVIYLPDNGRLPRDPE